MKQAFIDSLTNLMEKNDDVIVITADMGFSVHLDKNKEGVEILDFLYNRAIFSFISGLVFKNSRNIRIQEIESSKESIIEISNFWIAFLFPAAKSFGAYIDLNNLIVAKWAVYLSPEFYLVKGGKLPVEKIWKLLSYQLNKREMIIWKEKEINLMILLLPSIKYYSSSSNLMCYAKRMLEIDRKLYKNIIFYTSFITAFFMPRLIWNLLRKIYHTKKIIHDEEIVDAVFF